MLNHGTVEVMKIPWKQQLTLFWLFHTKPAKHSMLRQGRKHHPHSAGLKNQEKGSVKPAPKATCIKWIQICSWWLAKKGLCYGAIGGFMPRIPNFPCKQKE